MHTWCLILGVCEHMVLILGGYICVGIRSVCACVGIGNVCDGTLQICVSNGLTSVLMRVVCFYMS